MSSVAHTCQCFDVSSARPSTLSCCYCSVDFDSSKLGAEQQIWCGQGPQPPNPMVVERFQQVVSQLFQQVSLMAPRLSLFGDMYPKRKCNAEHNVVHSPHGTWRTHLTCMAQRFCSCSAAHCKAWRCCGR